MKKPKHKTAVVRGSGNVLRDFGRPNADVEQLKSILAAAIIKQLDRQGLTVRAAHAKIGVAAADFSRIRNADFGRFTIDRLMMIADKLDMQIQVDVRLKEANKK